MFERIARRWHVWSIEFKRFRARDERVAARDRRLRRRRGGRLHCGSLSLVSDGGRGRLSERVPLRLCASSSLTSYAERPDLTYTGQRKALAGETCQLVRREHHYPTPD